MAHALADFALERGDDFRNWRETSNYIIALQVHSSSALEELHEQAVSDGFQLVHFREPDLADQLTSIAFVPHETVKPYLSSLKLAGTDFHATTKCVGARPARTN